MPHLKLQISSHHPVFQILHHLQDANVNLHGTLLLYPWLLHCLQQGSVILHLQMKDRI